MGIGGQPTGAGEGGAAASVPLDLVDTRHNTLDSKRRVAIPKVHREQVEAAGLAEGDWVLCRELGGEQCLALFPPGCFEARLRKLEGMRSPAAGVGNKTVRAYLRKLRMSAARIQPDKQSRISLNEAQCGLAGITLEVAFVVAGDHLELWAPDRLQTMDDGLDFGDLAGELFGDF
jgi:DNA-binding transcriptional regulator/RsmH inhibitor MraZ